MTSDDTVRDEILAAAATVIRARRAKHKTHEFTVERENDETGELDEIEVLVAYESTPGFGGTYWEPPEPAACEIIEAWRVDTEDEVELTSKEQERLEELISEQEFSGGGYGEPDRNEDRYED